VAMRIACNRPPNAQPTTAERTPCLSLLLTTPFGACCCSALLSLKRYNYCLRKLCHYHVDIVPMIQQFPLMPPSSSAGLLILRKILVFACVVYDWL
jgi:hypothetical protein